MNEAYPKRLQLDRPLLTPSTRLISLTSRSLQGIEKARAYRFFDFSTFDVAEYEFFEQVENGDLNWHIADKILCFAGPHNSREVSKEGYRTLTPEDYIPYFRKKNVKLVVRLNKKYYDERKFINAGERFQNQPGVFGRPL